MPGILLVAGIVNRKQTVFKKNYSQWDIRKRQDMSLMGPESTGGCSGRAKGIDEDGAFGGTGRKSLLLVQDWEEVRSRCYYLSKSSQSS